MKPVEHLVVFGASGAIGGAVVQAARQHGWLVTAVSRSHGSPLEGVRSLVVDPLGEGVDPIQLATPEPYTSVCWAQGRNGSDSVYSLDIAAHREMYEANCTYILLTLQALLKGGLLAARSRLCVLSSVWQNLARQSKLSYCMSKAALQGLVLSASADMAKDGHLINGVLPGPIDTLMTRNHLSEEQMGALANATGHRRLVTLADVASIVCYLCSPENTCITGQFVEADLGFSHVRIV
jgi:3-oxoacyl-[acyl-carrier protein] reductase